MAAGSPTNRRKRKRNHRAQAAFASARLKRGSFWAYLPCFALLFGLALMGAVYVRNSHRAAAVWAAPDVRDPSGTLAVLLQGQHEINSQAARYAHPTTRCLATSSDDHGGASDLERRGPFTCVADARFFLRALSMALGFPTLLVIDVGPRPHPGGQLVLPQDMTHQEETRIEYAEEDLPSEVGLGFVETHESLTAEAWSSLIISLVQVTTEGGAIVIRGRNGAGLVTDGLYSGSGENAARDDSTELMKATIAVACGQEGVAVAVGDFDGGIIVVRRATVDENNRERGCPSLDKEKPAEDLTAAGSEKMQFEQLFLWTAGKKGTVESVQDMFGGADAVRKNARRRSERASCLVDLDENSTEPSSEPSVGKQVNLRTRRRNGTASISSPEGAALICLENHLKKYPQDVRAAFALEMLLRSIGGKSIDHRVNLLREKVCAASGQSGILLWKALHAQTAVAVAAGLLT